MKIRTRVGILSPYCRILISNPLGVIIVASRECSRDARGRGGAGGGFASLHVCHSFCPTSSGRRRRPKRSGEGEGERYRAGEAAPPLSDGRSLTVDLHRGQLAHQIPELKVRDASTRCTLHPPQDAEISLCTGTKKNLVAKHFPVVDFMHRDHFGQNPSKASLKSLYVIRGNW